MRKLARTIWLERVDGTLDAFLAFGVSCSISPQPENGQYRWWVRSPAIPEITGLSDTLNQAAEDSLRVSRDELYKLTQQAKQGAGW